MSKSADDKRAIALQEQGRHAEAVAAWREILKREPQNLTALINLGSLEIDVAHYPEAEALLRPAVAKSPDSMGAHVNLAVAVSKQGRLEEAIVLYKGILERWPDCSPALLNLCEIYKDQGRVEEAVALSQRGHAAGLYKAAREMSNHVMTLQYLPGITPAALRTAHAEFNACVTSAVTHAADIDRNPERKLRVGFVSNDFGVHPIGFLAAAPIVMADGAQMEAWCYRVGHKEDSITGALRKRAAHWADVQDPDPRALARQIAADRIDILIDLAGHSGRNRLPVFALKPAPIQVSWAGYMGTTGLAQMDYVLADRHHIPPGDEVHYTERVLRMPHDYVTYIPPGYAPAVGPLPADKAGVLTLGSFNNLAKVNDGVHEFWACILHALPDSRLLLKTRPLRDAETRARIHARYAQFGIDASRVLLEPDSQQPQLLARYNDVDIALDPFPYSGGLTTIEALWMGVPVVTRTGATFAGRHSTSHLRNVGLAELVTDSTPRYMAKVLELASDRDKLRSLRAGMRERMRKSPLMDLAGFARDFAQVMRGAWREWCDRPPAKA